MTKVFRVPAANALSREEKVRLSKPEQVSGFSAFESGEIMFNQTLLKQLRRAKIGANLLENIATYTESNKVPSLDPILESMRPSNRLEHNQSAHLPMNPLPEAFDVVTFRNNLNKLLGTPYNSNNPYTFHVQRRGKTLFLNIHQDPPPQNVPQAQLNGAYAGRRYEALSSGPMDAEGEYCGVFAMALGNRSLLVGAELDGKNDKNEYIELKTYKLLSKPKDRYTFERYKCLAFWIQSYLVGVPYIRCGFRSPDYHLVKEQTFATEQLPLYGAKYWSPSVCLAFVKLFLDWLSAQITDDESVVYEVTYDPKRQEMILRVMEMPSFLPSALASTWFTQS